MPRQFARYAGVGAVATAVHYMVLVGLVESGGAAPLPATLAGYVAGGLVSYALNRRLTFAGGRPHREAAWRFVAVAASGFAWTGLLMALLVGRLGAPYLPAQAATTLVVLFWGFLANRLWTFARPQGT
ncbi:GtrA family protein [Inquilinus limosus]|uniref:Polysaccharide synthesis protein GtrA n=1 Tax=Inquilinus limosus MP06 TaxID=1398085 RepID=A0A0A0D0P1_9PROT|nr:GtrA family protein [Inquilinus limosus]KGM31630.1 polysaccharide synthesis protein GtrA [Inquilinus limosus MP06]